MLHGALCSMTTNLMCNMTTFRKKNALTFDPTPGVEGVCLFVCFVALRPKSTAMVIAGQSVHLTTPFSGQGLNKRSTSSLCTYFRL